MAANTLPWLGFSIQHATIPVSSDETDTDDTSFTGEVRIGASGDPRAPYLLIFQHLGSECRHYAEPGVVQLLMSQSGTPVAHLTKDKPVSTPLNPCSILLAGLGIIHREEEEQQAAWRTRGGGQVVEDSVALGEPRGGQVVRDSVAIGEPLCAYGSARVGGIEVDTAGTLAGQLWVGGAALAHALSQPEFPFSVAGKTVVEIGSGTGAVGLAAAVAGASVVVLTDRPAVLPRLRAGIQRNQAALDAASATVTAASLEWGDARAAEASCPEGCELVLAADCLYQSSAEAQAALRDSFVSLARPRDAIIIHCFEERNAEGVTATWRAGLAAGGLRLVQETLLDAPPAINGRRFVADRRIVLEELRLMSGQSAADCSSHDL